MRRHGSPNVTDTAYHHFPHLLCDPQAIASASFSLLPCIRQFGRPTSRAEAAARDAEPNTVAMLPKISMVSIKGLRA